MNIPAQTLGRIHSNPQARAIQQEVQAIADLFVSCDETPADLLPGRPGEVLLEATSLASLNGDSSHYAQGSVRFDPRSGQVQQLQAEAWNTWALLANHPISSDPVTLSRQEGSTTYRSLSGSVTVDAQGNYKFRPLNAH